MLCALSKLITAMLQKKHMKDAYLFPLSRNVLRNYGRKFHWLYARKGPVRVKGGMSLRNGMWHDLQNDIIMPNVIF